MLDTLSLFVRLVTGFFKSRTALQLEILALRHQLIVLQRKQKKRPHLRQWDRMFWAWLSSIWDGWKNALIIVKPSTVVKWHRDGFKSYWRWKSRRKQTVGRKPVLKEVRCLIKKMCEDNPLWGAPRIHGELLKLGYNLVQSSVAKYMVKTEKPPSQTWKTFLGNHMGYTVAMDFFTVPTIFFDVLHVLILLDHERRLIVHFNVTANPTAEWVLQQIREAFPWDSAPRFLVHDRGAAFMANQSSFKAMGIETVISAPVSPWQNSYCERFGGSLRREALDHIIVLNENHLRRIISSYIDYYHKERTHLGLDKDCPVSRPVQFNRLSEIISTPILGGLHHTYSRIAV